MKKIFAILAFVLIGTYSFAQWSSGPGNLYMTGGNVGVGITAPTALIHGLSATNATLRMESSYSGSALQTLGQFAAKASNGQQFLMAFRHNAGGYNDMLQSCQLNATTFAEFMYFRFDTQKWEMRKGVVDAEFQNSGILYINNGTATGVFDPLVSGKVGIGTTSIASGVKLQVGGKVKCQEVEVAVTPWPDHVFKSGYNLLPLNEVENFINTNKHLPGVPSEEEVAQNGVNVGTMNATLLQKIEELTLYMIDLKKENDALKTRVSNLEK